MTGTKSFLTRCVLVVSLFLFGAAMGTSALAQIPGLDSLDTGGTQSKLPEIQFVSPQDNKETEEEVEAIRSLFDRQPWQFNLETLEQAWTDIQSVPEGVDKFSKIVQTPQVPNTWIAIFGVAVLFFLFLGYWSDRRLALAASYFLQWLPTAWPFWLRRLCKMLLVVISRMVFPALVLLGLRFSWSFFPGDRLYIPLLIKGMLLFLSYRGLQTLLYEILYNERSHLLQNADERVAQRIYRRVHYFLGFTVVLWFGIFVFQALQYRPDFIELLYFIYSLSLFSFAAYLLSRKSEFFSLFPDIDEPVYQRFVFFLRRFYTYVSGFSLLLGLLWLSGYRPLVNMLFFRSWAIIGLILGVRLLHRLLGHGINYYFKQDEHPDQKLVPAILQSASVVEVLILFNGVLSLLGLRDPLITLLEQPIATVGNNSVISPFSFINGIIVMVLVWMISRIVQAFLEERVYPASFDVGLEQMINLTVFYSFMALGSLIALNVVGLDLSVFTIFAGALAFGVGFGLQGIAKNFVSGLILIFTGLVKKGDYITVSDHSGYIQDVSWKKVHLRTPDHVDLIIPTVDLVESPIVNWSYSGNVVRMHIPVGVSYQSDMNVVKQALIEAAKSHDEVKSYPSPDVWLTEFGDNSVNFELLVWVDCRRITRERLKGELNFIIWNKLADNKIEIPFPQRDLHLRSVDPEIQAQWSGRSQQPPALSADTPPPKDKGSKAKDQS